PCVSSRVSPAQNWPNSMAWAPKPFGSSKTTWPSTAFASPDIPAPGYCQTDGSTMPARFQLVIDCQDPELLARFWAGARGYSLDPPPEGSGPGDHGRRDLGLPDRELGSGADSIIDPAGGGPRIWFHVMPDAKVVKNRLHLDIHVSGGRSV